MAGMAKTEQLTREQVNDLIFEVATAAGCRPEWHNGMFGPGWHCGCPGNGHGCDTECSAILLSRGSKGWRIRPKTQ